MFSAAIPIGDPMRAVGARDCIAPALCVPVDKVVACAAAFDVSPTRDHGAHGALAPGRSSRAPRGVILCRNLSARSASPRTGSSKRSLRAHQKLDYPITFQHRTPLHTATATASNGRRVTARSAPSRRSPALRANAALQVRPAHAVKFTHRF